ncbi:uncharacterized protein LOC121429059 [Lytechinus variegatus]|uniref:uncharacterized protein LOC121429059 n=1 Tax=Lytechinus variegatus TaxID=7654 RepID=UPI001BB2788A|nr:uncharacterized protein LOC121429059 [Lytechinus variegatus]
MSTVVVDPPSQAEDGSHRRRWCRPSRGFKRWLILAGLFMVTFLEVGSVRTLSLFLDDFTFQFDVSTSYMGAIYGLITGLPYFLGLINILLLRHFSVRQLMIVGGILSSAGLIAASFTTTASQITASLIAFGLGYMFIILPSHSCVPDYFPDHFEIATGIFSSGSSVGVMLMPLIFDAIIYSYGWRGGLLILGAFTTHFILIGSLLQTTDRKQPRQDDLTHRDAEGFSHGNVNFEMDSVGEKTTESEAPVHGWSDDMVRSSNSTPQIKTGLPSKSTDDKIKVDNGELGNCDSHQPTTLVNDISTVRTKTKSKSPLEDENKKVSTPSLNVDEVVNDGENNKKCSFHTLSSPVRFFKKHPLMITICVQVYISAIAYGTWLLFTIPNGQAKGLTDLRAVQLSIAGGVANFFGRFSCGFITSRNVARIEVWYMFANIVSAIAFFVNYVADSFWFLLILSLVFGFSIGFKIPAQFTLVMNVVGEKRFKTGLGILYVSSGLSFPFLGFIVGSIFDRFQSYNIAFCIMGALDVFAAILVIFPVVWQRFYKRTTD